VHFHKSFGVMQELFDHRDFTTFGTELHRCAADATPPGVTPVPQFLDLGCAPGGFSACLLQDHMLGPHSMGYGVSLPSQLGGFPMAFASDRLYVQLEDMMALGINDLICPLNSIDLCCADAQNLSNMFKARKTAVQYRGLRAKSRSLGIWALTVKECMLAFSRLRHGGGFVFRFGWRGVGADVHPSGEQVHPSLLAKYLEEEEWYKALTHWLFTVLKSLFKTLRPFKSEYVHQADVSFYMVCRSFDRKKYEMNDWQAKLQRAFTELSDCDDEAALVAGIKDGILDETKAEIDVLLEYVGRMRAIGIQSRKVTNPGDVKVNPMPTPTFAEDSDKSPMRRELTSDKASTPSKAPAASASSPTSKAAPKSKADPVAETDEAKDQAAAKAQKAAAKPQPRPRAIGEKPPPKGGVASSSVGSVAPPPAEPPVLVPQAMPWAAASMPYGMEGQTVSVGPASHIEAETAFARQMHMNIFQSQLEEWQKAEEARRRLQAEQSHEVQMKRALYLQTFHSQLQERRQQEMQLPSEQGQHGKQDHLPNKCQLPHGALHPGVDVTGDIQQGTASSPEWAVNPDTLPWIPGPLHARSEPVLPTAEPWTPASSFSEWSAVPAGVAVEAVPPSAGPSLRSLPDAPTPAVSSSTLGAAAKSSEFAKPAESASQEASAARSKSPMKYLGAKKADQETAPPLGDKECVAASESKLSEQSTSVPATSPSSDQAVESDGAFSSDEDPHRDRGRNYRHKRRAGRVVRERRNGRHRRNGALVTQAVCTERQAKGTWVSAAKGVLSSCSEQVQQGNCLLQVMRFGLFCAMAWSVNSIIFSLTRLQREGLLAGGAG